LICQRKVARRHPWRHDTCTGKICQRESLIDGTRRGVDGDDDKAWRQRIFIGTYLGDAGVVGDALMLDAGQRRGDRVRELLLSRPQIESLTPAERRILKLVGEDYTSKEIANLLNLSVRTVDNHRQHICDKLKLHGTHSLLKFAFDNSAYL
jgi:DNA-binding CsgD family transcriptional regulator